MQLPVIPFRGQGRPWPSIPRINWDHPLTWGLKVFYYDAGGGVVIDLVSGDVGVPTFGTGGTGMAPRTNQFGVNSWTTLGNLVSGQQFVEGNGSPTLDALTGTAPYSSICGYMRNGASFYGTFGAIYNLVEPSLSNNTPVWVAASDAGTGSIVSFVAGQVFDQFAFAAGVSQFATTAVVITTSAAYTGYHVDATNGFNSKSGTGTTTASGTGFIGLQPCFYNEGVHGADAGFNGTCFYGASWALRALNPDEVLSMHLDPWQFLIFPEDELSATMGTVIPFLVQRAFSSPGGTPASVTATFGAGVRSGNFVIGVATDGQSGTLSSTNISDGHGNNPTALLDNVFDSNGPFASATFYYKNVTNGATAFTYTSPGSVGFTAIEIQEWYGVDTVSPIDVHNMAISTQATTISTPTVTTTVNGDGVYSCMAGTETGFASITAAGGSGATFTLRNDDVTTMLCADASAVQTTAGAVHGTFTISVAQKYMMAIVAFKKAAPTTLTIPSTTLLMMGIG